MVDLKASNAKLVDRGRRILRDVLNIDADTAAVLLDAAGGHVKCAIVMHRRGVDRSEAERLLAGVGGHLRALE
ncbi:MAG: N-acetylmuramic acid 6-phosphate etherase, partial [Planctomycetota bacterium]